MNGIPSNGYERPANLAQALTFLAENGEARWLAAGATDIIPLSRREDARPRRVVDLTRLREELGEIWAEPGGMRIGAMTPLSTLAAHPLVAQQAEVLALAVATIGSRQIRNRATLAGNICNASPAGDSMPALLVLDAGVVLQSARGKRTLPLHAFLLGPGKTALESDEMMTEVFLPQDALGLPGWFRKMGNRNALTISLASCAMCIDRAGKVRMAFGSVAPVPVRLAEAEEAYGASRDAPSLRRQIIGAVRPITDIRASAGYRAEMAANLACEGLYELGKHKGGWGDER